MAFKDTERGKEYQRQYNHEYYQLRKEELMAAAKLQRAKNKTWIKEQRKGYRKQKALEISAKKRSDYLKNRQSVLEKSKRYRQQNHELVCKRMNEHYHANRTEILKERQMLRQRYPEREKHRKLREAYGIGLEEYKVLSDKQGGVCIVCGNPPKGKYLCVDHNHATGVIRGLLCDLCNQGLGCFGDDPKRLENAMRYLNEHGCSPVARAKAGAALLAERIVTE